MDPEEAHSLVLARLSLCMGLGLLVAEVERSFDHKSLVHHSGLVHIDSVHIDLARID